MRALLRFTESDSTWTSPTRGVFKQICLLALIILRNSVFIFRDVINTKRIWVEETPPFLEGLFNNDCTLGVRLIALVITIGVIISILGTLVGLHALAVIVVAIVASHDIVWVYNMTWNHPCFTFWWTLIPTLIIIAKLSGVIIIEAIVMAYKQVSYQRGMRVAHAIGVCCHPDAACWRCNGVFLESITTTNYSKIVVKV